MTNGTSTDAVANVPGSAPIVSTAGVSDRVGGDTNKNIPPRDRRAGRGPRRHNLTRPAGIGLGLSVMWFSLLVLIPLCLVIIQAVDGGWDNFITTLTNPQTSSAIWLTVRQAFIVTVINAVAGTLIAWVLVRDNFFGKRFLEVVIDIPFALPTIVAGLVLLSTYGPTSPVGINIANSEGAVFLALLFVTLPFVVRTVQPVLMELEPEVEQAAMSLGASRFQTWRRVVLPALVPAIAAGSTLAFARGISEYGSLVLLSGNLPFVSEVAAVRIFSYIENDNTAAAASVAAILLIVALIAIALLDLISRKVARRG